MSNSTRNTVIQNFAWRFAERCGAQLVTFLVSIVLARLLDPVAYGTIALITVFTTILEVFIESGLGNALIQKKDADDLDFSTVFFANFAICAVLYLLLFCAAPFIASFYQRSEMTAMIRVLGLTLVISGVRNVQNAYISKNMLFKRFFFATLSGTVSSAVFGILIAFNGGGVWALIAQSLINNAIGTLVMWFSVNWRPRWQFSFARLKRLYSFGWKLLCSSLIDSVYNNVRSLIIGKKYSSEDLGLYNKGNSWPNLFITVVNSSINSILFPAMSQVQDDVSRVKRMVRRSIKTCTYIIAPLMLGLCAVAEPLVRLILTEKWVECVPYLRIFAITYIFYPMNTANLSVIKSLGRSDLFMRLEIIKKTFGMVILLCTMWFGVKVMAYGLLLATVVNQIANAWFSKRLIGYSYFDQIKDIFPSIGLSLLMAAAVWGAPMLQLGDFATLVIQVGGGVLIYAAGSVLSKNKEFFYLLSIVKKTKAPKAKSS